MDARFMPRKYIPVDQKEWVMQHIPKHPFIDERLTWLDANMSAAVAKAVHLLYARLIENAEPLTYEEHLRAVETYADVTNKNRKSRDVHLKKPTVDELATLGKYFTAHFPNTPYLRSGDNRRVLIVIALVLAC